MTEAHRGKYHKGLTLLTVTLVDATFI